MTRKERKQRRKMGLTIRNMRKIAKKLKKEGELEGLDRQGVAAAILAEAVAQNPMAYEKASIDWDGLLAFIEKLLPIILQFISIFGV